MEKVVIIVAGGKGERMNSNTPKQFMLINGKPLLMHTIEAFYAYDNSIFFILALPVAYFDYWKGLTEKYPIAISYELVEGGETRFHTVKNALEKVPQESLVAVHDAVRPLVSADTIKKCFDLAQLKGTAIPVIEMTQSLRMITDTGSMPANRNKFLIVQTPQVFMSDIIIKSYKQPFSELFTDDASVVESSGYQINLTEGNHENIKITTPVDLKIAGFLL